MITSLADMTDAQKADMIASLSIFLAASGTAEEGEDLITPAKLQAIASASGNSLSESLATLFASVASSAPGGVLEAYMPSPGGGGGGYVVFVVLLVDRCSLLCRCGSLFVGFGSRCAFAAEAAVVAAEALRPKQLRKNPKRKKKPTWVVRLWTCLVAEMVVVVETTRLLQSLHATLPTSSII